MMYLLIIILLLQVFQFAGYQRVLMQVRKKDKSIESSMSNMHQWIASNDKSVLQNLEKLNELVHSLYIRTRMIDLMLRNKASGEKQHNGQELKELESLLLKEQWTSSLITDATHKDAIDKIRSEDIHYYYATLIEELQQLNKQISKNTSRTDALPGAYPATGKNDAASPVNGWYNRVNKVI